jgi:hypothetical protein
MWIFIVIYINLGKSIMEGSILDSFVISLFQPALEHSKSTTFFELVYQFWDGAHANGIQKLLDVDFITIKLKKGSKHLWSIVGVDFEEVDFDEFVHLVVVKVSG